MNDKQRAEFEKFAADKYILESSKSGAYMSVPTKQAFECWQAAIASAVVELPQPNNDSQDQIMRGVYASLDKAGIRYE